MSGDAVVAKWMDRGKKLSHAGIDLSILARSGVSSRNDAKMEGDFFCMETRQEECFSAVFGK